MIKILAIGNSYSQDATSMIELLDKNIMVRNLYIGGCSLEMHYDNIKDENQTTIFDFQNKTIEYMNSVKYKKS